MGHGYIQGPMHKVEDQRQAIRKTNDAIAAVTGRPPVGWECPGLTETEDTIDILAEEGVKYTADWVLDDQPTRISTSTGSIVSVPYSLETNDITIFALQNHGSDTMYKRTLDQFEQLYIESETIMRVMAISIHPYLSGVPHRLGYLEKIYEHIKSKPGVLMWTGEQIYNWYQQEMPSR
jgi:Predicted xylanase/chitin deacetylase